MKENKEDAMFNKTLKVIRTWWRPASCVFIAGTLLVHGIIVPIYNMLYQGEATDLTGLSLLVTSIAAAFAVREWGKAKGNENGTTEL